MPDAILDNRLADSLVDVLDDIRRDVPAALGTRPYRVQIVTRTWSSGQCGVGVPSDSVLELDPAPRVKRVSHDRLGPAGRESAGNITLSGVSLRYTERELQPVVEAGMEVAYRVVDDHGQGQTPKWFVLVGSPVPRRGDQAGDGTDWYLQLGETTAMGPLDGSNAP